MKALSSALNCDRAAGIEFCGGGEGRAEKPDLRFKPERYAVRGLEGLSPKP